MLNNEYFLEDVNLRVNRNNGLSIKKRALLFIITGQVKSEVVTVACFQNFIIFRHIVTFLDAVMNGYNVSVS